MATKQNYIDILSQVYGMLDVMGDDYKILVSEMYDIIKECVGNGWDKVARKLECNVTQCITEKQKEAFFLSNDDLIAYFEKCLE